MLRGASIYIINKIQLKITNRINKDTYLKTLIMASLVLKKKKSGEFINRITNDAEAISESFLILLDIAIYLFGSLIVLVYIFVNTYILGIVIIIFVIALYFITNYFNPKIKKLMKKLTKKKINIPLLLMKQFQELEK